MSDEAVVAAVPPKPKRKLPFKATALQQKASVQNERKSLDDDGLSLFQRRDEVLPAFEEEAKRMAREREARKKTITPKKEQKWQPTTELSGERKHRLSFDEEEVETGTQLDAPNMKPGGHR